MAPSAHAQRQGRPARPTPARQTDWLAYLQGATQGQPTQPTPAHQLACRHRLNPFQDFPLKSIARGEPTSAKLVLTGGPPGLSRLSPGPARPPSPVRSGRRHPARPGRSCRPALPRPNPPPRSRKAEESGEEWVRDARARARWGLAASPGVAWCRQPGPAAPGRLHAEADSDCRAAALLPGWRLDRGPPRRRTARYRQVPRKPRAPSNGVEIQARVNRTSARVGVSGGKHVAVDGNGRLGGQASAQPWRGTAVHCSALQRTPRRQ